MHHIRGLNTSLREICRITHSFFYHTIITAGHM